jgi:hypothetical protein
MLIVLKCGSLNLLEPSRPVQACNGIALPFTYTGKTFYFMFTSHINKEVEMAVYEYLRMQEPDFYRDRIFTHAKTGQMHQCAWGLC